MPKGLPRKRRIRSADELERHPIEAYDVDPPPEASWAVDVDSDRLTDVELLRVALQREAMRTFDGFQRIDPVRLTCAELQGEAMRALEALERLTDDIFREPHDELDLIHDVVWTLRSAIEKGDRRTIRAMLKPSVGVMDVDETGMWRSLSVQYLTAPRFISILRESIDAFKMHVRESAGGGPAVTDSDIVIRIAHVIYVVGRRAYPYLAEMDINQMAIAIARKFPAPLSLILAENTDDLVARALRAVGVPPKEVWNRLHAAERVRAGRARRKAKASGGV